jgi:hypothetical protein
MAQAATDFNLTASCVASGNTTGPLAGQKDTAQWNVNSYAAPDVTLSFGTGNNQAKEWYRDYRTLAGTTYDQLNFNTVLNPFGGTIVGLTIRYLGMAIDTPDGVKTLRVGPQGQTNAGQFMFGGVTAAVYFTFTHNFQMLCPITGWTITAGTGMIFPVYNPTGSSINYRIWVGFTV